MSEARRYWQHVRLTAAGELRREEIQVARDFWLQHWRADLADVPDYVIQLQLIQQMPAGDRGAELCLRCYISHLIEQVCRELEQRFGKAHGLRCADLLRFVLNDRRPDRRSKDSASRTPSTINKILQTVDLAQGSLSTWTKRLVHSDPELCHYLLEHGVYLVTDWALLNAVRSPEQLQRLLSQVFALTDREIQQSCRLLETYHAVYRRDRRQTGRSGSRCAAPTPAQLQQMVELLATGTDSSLSAQDVLEQLQALATKLRQHRISVQLNAPPTASIEQPEFTNQVVDRTRSDDDDEQNEFLTRYQQEFLTGLDLTLAQVVTDRVTYHQRKQPPQDRAFLEALDRVHCRGESMSQIAPHLNLTRQDQVTRLLKLKQFRADVRQRLLVWLRDRVLALAASYTDPARLTSLDRQLDAALADQVDQMITEVERELYAANRRHSLFTCRLCRYLES